KVDEHHLAADTTVDTAAARKDELLGGWARQWLDARAEGLRGRLEPNVVVEPDNQVIFRVPGHPVGAYVLAAGNNAADAAALVERLTSVGVQVYRLRRGLAVRAFHAYGAGGAARARIPAGDYVVPMGQAQKHWVEALLGENA